MVSMDRAHKLKIVGYVALLYVVILGLITLLDRMHVINEDSFSSKLGSDDASIPFTLFFMFFGFFFAVLIYIFNSIIAGRFIRISIAKALVYMSVAGFVAPLGEYAVNALSLVIFENPIFLYHIAPVHHGYTSLIMMALWPTYGFHLYCFHEVLAQRKEGHFTDAMLATIMGIDGIMMESLVNILSVLLFSANIFYYVPNDLFHVSSIVILPVYVTIGFVGIKLIRTIEKQNNRMIFVCLMFLLSGLFFLLGRK